MATRIKDLTTTATAAASDDYLVIDGATNGTRKMLAEDIGGGKQYDFASSLSPSIDSRGVYTYNAVITVADSSVVTNTNVLNIKAYLLNGATVYPLIVVYGSTDSVMSRFYVYLKSLYGNPQNTSSTTVSGTLHVVAPFEISSVTASM